MAEYINKADIIKLINDSFFDLGVSDDRMNMLTEVEELPVVTINDTSDENIVTKCNHNADPDKKVGRYAFGNDEFNLESAYHDCKLVFDGITDDDSFQEADTGLILYYANEIIYALHEALQGKDTNVPSKDVIYRQNAIDALDCNFTITGEDNAKTVHQILKGFCDKIKALPSAQPEIKPIDYQDCANAMMKMWVDNVLTDGEYNRIMDKLNKHEMERRTDD